MSLPDVKLSISDGALGSAIDNTDNVHVKMGVSSKGTPGQLYSFVDVATLVATLGVGPLVEAAAHALAVSGGPILCMAVTVSTDGDVSEVTHVGDTGPTVTVDGKPNDSYEVLVKIIAGGVRGTGTFKASLDGGDTFGNETTIPSDGDFALVGTGQADDEGNEVTLTFAAGTYVADESYSIICTAPAYSTSDLHDAMLVLLALSTEFFMVHVVGTPGTAADAATLAGGVATDIEAAAATRFRYLFAIVECPNDGDTVEDSDDIDAFAAFTSARVCVCAGDAEIISPISNRVFRRNAAWAIAARASKVEPGTDLAYVGSGPLGSVSALHRDENQTPLLDAAQFSTLRTIVGRRGFFIANGRLMAPTGSDFRLIQYRRVMDKACAVVRDAMLGFLNSSVRVNADGTIYEKDAVKIEKSVASRLASEVITPGMATAATAAVSRTNNVTSTSQLLTTVRVRPLGYAKDIEVDIGFAAPA